MEVVSFEYLRKILNEEKKSQNLTKIPDDFYETVRMYIEGKKKLAKEKKDEIELRNIERIVENIFNLFSPQSPGNRHANHPCPFTGNP